MPGGSKTKDGATSGLACRWISLFIVSERHTALSEECQPFSAGIFLLLLTLYYSNVKFLYLEIKVKPIRVGLAPQWPHWNALSQGAVKMVCSLLPACSAGWDGLDRYVMLNCLSRLTQCPLSSVGSCCSEVDCRLGAPVINGSYPTQCPFLSRAWGAAFVCHISAGGYWFV